MCIYIIYIYIYMHIYIYIHIYIYKISTKTLRTDNNKPRNDIFSKYSQGKTAVCDNYFRSSTFQVTQIK